MITAKELRERLRYDPETGIFTWRERAPHQRDPVGAVAGCCAGSTGYVEIMLNQVRYLAHRLAWLYVTGEWPPVEIDHRNTIRADNRFDNLRLTDGFPNQQNVRKPTRRNTTGALGVSRTGRGFRATVRMNGRNQYSTTFDTVDEAYRTYVDMKRRLHPGCTL